MNLSDLKRKSVRGGMVTMAAQAVSIVINLTSTVILARLLTPEDYGTIAMVLAITTFASMFRDLGLSSAAIQKIDLTHAQQSNLFWLNVAMGAAFTVTVASASPLVAWFYGKQELVMVTFALSASFLFASFGAQHSTSLVRDMQFRKNAAATICGSLVTLGVAIICALNGLAYWSLVWGNLAGTAVTSLLLFLLSPFWPSWYRKGAGIRDMLGFGANVTGFNIVNYLHRRLDNILIGRFWGSEALGMYSKAYSLLMLPNQAVRGPINAVAFPAMSKLKDNPDAFRAYYRRITLAAAAISMPVASCLFVIADPLIIVALGERWLPSAAIFRILAIVAFIQPSSSFRNVVVKSLGKSRDYLKQGIMEASFTSTGFCIGVAWGATGVAISYVVSTWLVLPFLFNIAFRDAPVGFGDFFQAIRYPALASILAGLAGWFILNHVKLHFNNEAVQVALVGSSFIMIYLALFIITTDGRRLIQIIHSAVCKGR